ncbi:MAG TPA: helix-turn-helix domain-containing protein [Bacteroidales bacterium]|nr:helix-turn-helix domain-containing protein [Bacteroidales bacterium]
MPKEINGIKFFDIADLIDVLNVSEITARRYIQDGKIKAIKIKGKWLVSEEHLNEYLRGADNVKEK